MGVYEIYFGKRWSGRQKIGDSAQWCCLVPEQGNFTPPNTFLDALDVIRGGSDKDSFVPFLDFNDLTLQMTNTSFVITMFFGFATFNSNAFTNNDVILLSKHWVTPFLTGWF